MISRQARLWIESLQLESHPEGGYFCQTYRSSLMLPRSALPPGFSGGRSASTAIYFLLDGSDFSAFHRLRSDELWHHYAGGTLLVHVIDPGGAYSQIRLGSNLADGEVFQGVVKAGCWFASELKSPESYALVGCTVSPGFDFEDFEMAKRAELTRHYPQHRALIERLTREL